jgi:hypothetical protein
MPWTSLLPWCDHANNIWWEVQFLKILLLHFSPAIIRAIALMIEVVITSETSVNFYKTIWHNIPEDNHPQTRHRYNLKSDRMKHCYRVLIWTSDGRKLKPKRSEYTPQNCQQYRYNATTRKQNKTVTTCLATTCLSVSALLRWTTLSADTRDNQIPTGLKASRQEEVLWNADTAPSINLAKRWRWIVSFTFRPLYPHIPIRCEAEWPQSQCQHGVAKFHWTVTPYDSRVKPDLDRPQLGDETFFFFC